MNSPGTILLRLVGVLGLTIVGYGVVVAATRMALLSYGVAAAVAGVGVAWSLFAD